MTRSALALAAIAAAGLAWGGCGADRTPSDGSEEPFPTSQVEETVGEILRDDDPLRRAAELAALFPRLEPEALPAVQRAYEEAALDNGDMELILFGIWWARFDPEAAVRWTATDWRAGFASVSTAVLRSWARRAPREAYEHASAKRFPVQRDLSRDAVISGWDESGQPGLEALVRGIADSQERQRSADVLARRRVVSLGPEGALAWADSLEDPAFRELMRPRVASAVARLHPAIAARWAEPQIAQSERATGLPRRIATRWVRSDPEAAMAWLATLPAVHDRDDGVAEAFRDWLRTDPAKALAWIESQPVEPWNEEAFGVWARSILSSQDPERALELASRFSKSTLRDRTSTVVARVWLQSDREAADAWLEQSDLSPDVIRRARMVRTRSARPPEPPAKLFEDDEEDP